MHLQGVQYGPPSVHFRPPRGFHTLRLIPAGNVTAGYTYQSVYLYSFLSFHFAFISTVTVNSSVFSEWMLADDLSGLGVDESENNKIMRNKLAAYPNPFREKTVIRLECINHVDAVTRSQHSITIYDITGRLVRTFALHSSLISHHELTWDGRDIAGNGVKSGIYFLTIKGYKPLKIIKVR